MFSRRTVTFIVVIAIIAVSILLISVTSQRHLPAYGPGRGIVSLIAPFQTAVFRSIRFIETTWRHYFTFVSVARENDQLKKALNEAINKNNALKEIALANERLRSLLNFQNTLSYPVLSAEIISREPSVWYNTVTINKGSDNDVQKGMPVVVAEGVVGLVTDVSANNAIVLLIIDQNSAVDALIQKTRARGIVKGGSVDQCYLQYVLRKHVVDEGDTVITSGLDGVFPKGLRIGYVSKVVKQNAGIFQDITIVPYVDFERLEEVLVLLNPPMS